MNSFIIQIKEDISDYQEKFPNISNIDKEEWAFNFWVLDKLYSEDEESIESLIVDYKDKGIDCYVWHEDSHDLYIIQNKFYSENTPLSSDYIHEFLHRPLSYLENNSYTKCPELQSIYNKNCDYEDFSVHLCLYVTNNSCKTAKNIDSIQKFNADNVQKKCQAYLYSLDDIYDLYYNEPNVNKKTLEFEIETINKSTSLNINNTEYGMNQSIDARYTLVPVIQLYKLYAEAKKSGYPLFDANIREYLGASGAVNKKILNTLNDQKDRVNFFYYNNGITVIVDDFSSQRTKAGKNTFKIINPQIVNGCQTVSTINVALSNLKEELLEDSFKDTYVMLKILKIPNDNAALKQLYKNIVTYNNSQNSINEKTFVANSNEFRRLQSEFENKGLLMCIKQSDKHTFKTKYTTASTLLDLNKRLLEKFSIKHNAKTKDFIFDLEKFLQVILAFVDSPQNSIQNKSKLLKPDSEQYKKVVSFIKDPAVTISALIDLYLLYMRAEQEKKESKDGRSPIPLYLISCFSNFSCDKDPEKISEKLSDKVKIDRMLKLYTKSIKRYYVSWIRNNPNKDYNAMIKSTFDQDSMREHYEFELEFDVESD